MKINELREGIFDRSTQSSIANFGKVAAKQWNIYKQNLQRKNNFEKLSPQQLQGHLEKFVQDNILVRYDVGPEDRNEAEIIKGMKAKILATDDIAQQSASFATIAQQASKLGLSPDQQGNLPTPKDCKVTSANNKVTVCGQEINPTTDKQLYDKLKDLLAKQGRA